MTWETDVTAVSLVTVASVCSSDETDVAAGNVDVVAAVTTSVICSSVLCRRRRCSSCCCGRRCYTSRCRSSGVCLNSGSVFETFGGE